MEAKSGWTNIYIYPGYRFKVMDGLVTNFHLPESDPHHAGVRFAGREHVLAAYEEAVREKYRFFSFWRRHVHQLILPRPADLPGAFSEEESHAGASAH